MIEDPLIYYSLFPAHFKTCFSPEEPMANIVFMPCKPLSGISLLDHQSIRYSEDNKNDRQCRRHPHVFSSKKQETRFSHRHFGLSCITRVSNRLRPDSCQNSGCLPGSSQYSSSGSTLSIYEQGDTQDYSNQNIGILSYLK